MKTQIQSLEPVSRADQDFSLAEEGITVEKKIISIRDTQVILDRDLASLYGVETRVFNQAVTRNIERFPLEFRFQITAGEYENLKSHFVPSSWGGLRKMPYA